MFQTLITLALALSVNSAFAQYSNNNVIENRPYPGVYGYANSQESEPVDSPAMKRYKGTTVLPAVRPTKIPKFAQNNAGTYYDWTYLRIGNGKEIYAVCGQYTPTGAVLNKGAAVENSFCEAVNSSYYFWAQAKNGAGYCYQFSPYAIVMNEGNPLESTDPCETTAGHSKPTWGRGAVGGHAQCYRLTPNGYALNDGWPVPDIECYDNSKTSAPSKN